MSNRLQQIKLIQNIYKMHRNIPLRKIFFYVQLMQQSSLVLIYTIEKPLSLENWYSLMLDWIDLMNLVDKMLTKDMPIMVRSVVFLVQYTVVLGMNRLSLWFFNRFVLKSHIKVCADKWTIECRSVCVSKRRKGRMLNVGCYMVEYTFLFLTNEWHNNESSFHFLPENL